jgi:hypothetical protein
MKKSAEGGCSWGQVEYGWYFNSGGGFVEKEEKAFEEWLEKAAKQNNVLAMDWLGFWFESDGEDIWKAVPLYRSAAELGWKQAMGNFARMLAKGKGCAKDWRQAAIWSAKANNLTFFCCVFCDAYQETRQGSSAREFDRLCYSLGWGVYWYVSGVKEWNRLDYDEDEFGRRCPEYHTCLDYYCSCVELQQKSIFTFLLFWNQTVGIKDVGVMIGKRVWEDREDNMVKSFSTEE